MVLHLKWFPLSSPSRAIKFLLAANNVEHQSAVVQIGSGESRKDAYNRFYPRGHTPILMDNEHVLSDRYPPILFFRAKF